MLLYCANVSGSRSRHLVGVQDTKYWDYLYSDVVLGILTGLCCFSFSALPCMIVHFMKLAQGPFETRCSAQIILLLCWLFIQNVFMSKRVQIAPKLMLHTSLGPQQQT